MACIRPVATYLEVAVLVALSAGQSADLSNGCHVNVGVWEEEEIHAAGAADTLLSQLGVEVGLRSQNRLSIL